ncbi:tRNA (5-methylaminomethyl-2-thiouridine)(34)-methyltransferase MnmD [Rhizobium sp. L1K21]|uniref:tRNA (5-methylaminomethyl-2-thiouridine)(34)-methyltransferase MnmD n=1 Tax=Rhizobium sp. L1K21 TaxID=2954933 RepID=UPI0020930725|nr:tRNA (5-methylaminomethyl-2-thiouridine)(34)-methyltransferase MnmD [Rhizobium sp. L1K21]MCO6185116.1 tRNA (5-methylaminomethyl-2-thiouridine)(34)-methyltransferase MnmD [Rhizobium sp. L1K21]
MENETTSPQPLEWHEGDMPYSTTFGDHFYCRTDGRAECDHVFIDANHLHERWAAGGECVIGELGFGTGLNFCETWRQWSAFQGTTPTHGSLHFISFELFPMDRESIKRALIQWPILEHERERLAAAWPDTPSGIVSLEFDDNVRLSVICGDALSNLATSQQTFDAWYLDGFAPSRNPDMWSLELMQAVYDHTRPGGSFGTYAAAGFVRRNLQTAGFKVERRPGFAGKREMLCGIKD